MRSPADVDRGQPVCRSTTTNRCAGDEPGEIQKAREDFIAAAVRAERAGFDGVEIHGAHGYLMCQFLRPESTAHRHYGGPLENRARILFDIVEGVRKRCDAVRPRRAPLAERFGLRLEIRGALPHA